MPNRTSNRTSNRQHNTQRTTHDRCPNGSHHNGTRCVKNTKKVKKSK